MYALLFTHWCCLFAWCCFLFSRRKKMVRSVPRYSVRNNHMIITAWMITHSISLVVKMNKPRPIIRCERKYMFWVVLSPYVRPFTIPPLLTRDLTTNNEICLFIRFWACFDLLASVIFVNNRVYIGCVWIIVSVCACAYTKRWFWCFSAVCCCCCCCLIGVAIFVAHIPNEPER